jgi:hypothetical protein
LPVEALSDRKFFLMVDSPKLDAWVHADWKEPSAIIERAFDPVREENKRLREQADELAKCLDDIISAPTTDDVYSRFQNGRNALAKEGMMKRYDFTIHGEQGEWVKFSDVDALQKQADELATAIALLVDKDFTFFEDEALQRLHFDDVRIARAALANYRKAKA